SIFFFVLVQLRNHIRSNLHLPVHGDVIQSMQFSKPAHPHARSLRNVLPGRSFFFPEQSSHHLDAPHFLLFVTISQLAKRNFHFCCPSLIVNVRLGKPYGIPTC